MNPDHLRMVLESYYSRIVGEGNGETLDAWIERRAGASWVLAAYLPGVTLERPTARLEAPHSDVRRIEGGLELSAALESGHGGWQMTDQIIVAPYGFQVRRTLKHTGGNDPQVGLWFELAYSQRLSNGCKPGAKTLTVINHLTRRCLSTDNPTTSPPEPLSPVKLRAAGRGNAGVTWTTPLGCRPVAC